MTEFSITYWFRADSEQSSSKVMCAIGGTSTSFATSIQGSSSPTIILNWFNGSSYGAGISYDIEIGRWYKVCKTYDTVTSTGELFIDDVSVGTQVHGINISSGFLQFGENADTSYFDGKLAFGSAFDEVLTTTEQAYLGTVDTPYPYTDYDSSIQAKALGSWNLSNWNGNDGDETTDQTSNSNDLTAIGSPTYESELAVECDEDPHDSSESSSLPGIPLITTTATDISIIINTSVSSGTWYWGDGNVSSSTNFPTHTYTDGDPSHEVRLELFDTTVLTGLYSLDGSIIDIDLSEFSNLRSLILIASTPGGGLTSFQASTVPLLTTLDLPNNSLATLDLSPLTNLVALDLENNPITTLDISNNTALLDLKVSGTSLTSASLDDIFEKLDNSGVTLGTFAYNGALNNPTSVSFSRYTSLVNKGWAIIGNIPPDPSSSSDMSLSSTESSHEPSSNSVLAGCGTSNTDPTIFMTLSWVDSDVTKDWLGCTWTNGETKEVYATGYGASVNSISGYKEYWNRQVATNGDKLIIDRSITASYTTAIWIMQLRLNIVGANNELVSSLGYDGISTYSSTGLGGVIGFNAGDKPTTGSYKILNKQKNNSYTDANGVTYAWTEGNGW